MDSHLASACERARASLLRQIPGLQMSLHFASDYAGNEARCRPAAIAIAEADIVVVRHAVPGRPLPAHPAGAAGPPRALRRDGLRLSAGEVVQAHPLGQLRHEQAGQRPDGAAEEAARQARCRRQGQAPPPAASADEDAAPPAAAAALHPRHRAGRAGLLHHAAVLAGWLARKRANLVRLVVDRGRGGPRARLRGLVAAQPPVDYPEVGVYHPRMDAGCVGRWRDAALLPQVVPAQAQGTVGLLLLRSYLLAATPATTTA
jgi:magnesium chelatase subunit H